VSAPSNERAGRADAVEPSSPTSELSGEAVDLEVNPRGSLEVLSQLEVEQLRAAGHGNTHELFRRCALAVLNTGSTMDDAAEIFERYRDFDIEIVQRTRGIALRVVNAPPSAFVDGRMIEGIKEHLFSVLRDIVFITTEVASGRVFDLESSTGISNAVFHILRNARALVPRLEPNLAVCWGGHAIGREEYDYSKEIGYQLGLRGIDVCTGCGPGAMKGPMKGAAVGHNKQRNADGRYMGISEPGIIAAEPPNPMVNHLVIMPDIEKRLEAFARIAHTIIVFPGGVGTAEEVLFLLGLLLHPANREVELPVIFTGPACSRTYFEELDALIGETLGAQGRACYEVVVDDAVTVARRAAEGCERVRSQRRSSGDAFYFNWLLETPLEFQRPFEPTHENMAALTLSRDVPPHVLAAHLRQAFSGIVAGNVKAEGIRAVRQHGPFEIHAERDIMRSLDRMLRRFAEQGRMKLSGDYVPCYRLV